MVYICIYIPHTHSRILLSRKKNETLSFATAWVDLEGIMLSEIGRERQILYEITYMKDLKNKLVNITKKKETHRYREQSSGYW